MMKYHVNPKTGNPSVCHAVIKCRFGGESDHYFTQDQARKDYEKKNAAFTTPQSLSATDEISRAKKTRKPEEINRIISNGNEASLIKLASNKHVTADNLRDVWKASDSDLVKTSVALNPKCPVEILDRKRMLDFRNRGIEDQLKKRFTSENVTEEQAKILLENFRTSDVPEAILANPNTKISQKTLFDLAILTNHGRFLNVALKNPRFDVEKATKTGALGHHLELAAISSRDPASRQFIYNHPSVEDRTRKKLVENYPKEKFGIN